MKAKKCPKCGIEKLSSFFNSSKSRKIASYCKECLYTLQKRRWRERKCKAIAMMGGKCSNCGYDKCVNALEFHHLDVENKDYDWGKLRMLAWKRIVEELKKCILLCANCHREIHAKVEDYSTTNIDNAFLNNSGPKSSGFCPTCHESTYGTKYCSVNCASYARRKVERPSKEELQKLISEHSFSDIGRKFGVSDVAVKKWCKFYGF